jgi:hypothetical protein
MSLAEVAATGLPSVYSLRGAAVTRRRRWACGSRA